MKIHPDVAGEGNFISSYDDMSVIIRGDVYRQNFVVARTQLILPWAAGGFASLTAEDMDILAKHQPQVLIFGTGSKPQFPPTHLLAPLVAQNVPWEIMNFGAACRTYNLLLSEGREVMVALFFT